MQAKAPVAVPIVLNFLVGIGTGFFTVCTSLLRFGLAPKLNGTATIYGIDLFAGQGGAVTATVSLHVVHHVVEGLIVPFHPSLTSFVAFLEPSASLSSS